MRFKEANPENSGCEARGKIYFRKTSRILVKGQCPNGRMRCCMFCELDCKTRCELSEVLLHQPESMRDRFNCQNLVPSLKLAWKWLSDENEHDETT